MKIVSKPHPDEEDTDDKENQTADKSGDQSQSSGPNGGVDKATQELIDEMLAEDQ